MNLRGRVQMEQNNVEVRNALAHAEFLNRFGKIRDRRVESQRNHASGLNLVEAIILWSTA